jgi:hypothetical protein
MQNPNTFLAKDGVSDADLIPAARDLYEALGELRDIVQGLLDGMSHSAILRTHIDSFTLQPADAALAKARGEI